MSIAKPIKSNRFGTVSLYFNKIHYFPHSIKDSTNRENKPFEIQVIYDDGKLRQDTFYINSEFRNFLLNNI